MAKILVADDNSNVQKTVALALAELGVEVASVNNGEAAVRKLPGFLPDLVLADIFMPVRNGYEVCEFVKNDPRFSHMPVVLLVGAFDPLDEREAQRVGADGILKKPFVPPDPLITMVKTLLERTLGERLVSVAATPHPVAAKVAAERSTAAPVIAPAPETSQELSAEEFPPPLGRIEFAEGEHPVAFGSLLETPTVDAPATKPPALEPIEPVDDEQILTSARDATLGDPIFWRNDSQAPETEPVPAEEDSKEISSTDLGQAWKKGEDSPSHREEANSLQPVEPLELVLEEQVEALPTIAESNSILIDQAAQSSLTVEPHKPTDLAANPLEWMASAPPAYAETVPDPTPALDEPVPDASDTVNRAVAPDHTEAIAEDLTEALDETLAEVPVVALPQVSGHATEKVPEPVVVPVVEQAAAPVEDKIPELTAPASAIPKPVAEIAQKLEIPTKGSDQSTTDTARSIPRQDWAALTASLELRAMEEVHSQHKTETSPAAQTHVLQATSSAVLPGSNGQSVSPDPALVEAVVQRVLEKMRPQVVDIITKEFLRPIVQALVRREIEKH